MTRPTTTNTTRHTTASTRLFPAPLRYVREADR
ncbi:hypothetical protein BJY27_005603 [Streptomyces rapamycinicus]|uniref:Uncharacterized protein n=1 Tax=Streptomyces rapamycinicus TaxID=1226757 RepID=A0ABR6LQM3_9ACTN|nr:hypothetical protein [Streptomyces rapamycinicus]MBB4784641.1 hypothetical protein [Streptomyces rapamycinicus]MBB4784642.1 hypothetical protein [Streptomyces rapamycinicus]